MTATQGGLFDGGDKTVAQARREIFAAYNDPHGTTCQCCDQHVKLYGWPLQVGMVLGLAHLLRAIKNGDDVGGEVHMNNPTVPTKVKESRSFPKLVHWGLIEPGSKRGWWRATELSEPFLRGALSVAHRVQVYNDTKVSESEEFTNVHKAYGEHFDYDAMVNKPGAP